MNSDPSAPGPATPREVTLLLQRVADGDRGSRDDLLREVYTELRAMARSKMAAERSDHTLQATALVHEAYLRLVGGVDLAWRDRRHFHSAAAEAMRRILIEHARGRGSQRRGGTWRRAPLDAVEMACGDDSARFLALDEAIARLQEVDERAAELVRLRFYAGLEVEEAARALDVSRRTALRDWEFAKAWLFQALEDPEDDPETEP